MAGLGTIVNTITILVGGFAGLLLKRFFNERLTNTIMQGLGLAVIIVGFGGALSASFAMTDGSIETRYTVVMVVSLASGALMGELLNIEDKLSRFGSWCERKFFPKGNTSTFAQAFISTSLIFCVGAMSIIGALEDGINHNTDILFAKAVIDGITAVVFASALGFGVLLSSGAVLIYQGLITVAAVFMAPFLDETVIGQMSLVGSVLIGAIGLNMLKVSKIKVGNLLPSLFIPIFIRIFGMLFEALGW